MKILLLSDEECKALYDCYVPGRLKEYDLVLSCGDLKADYLSFIVTMGRAPVKYVHGNHDVSYTVRPPEGCDCIEDDLIIFKGLRIVGLGGCPRYNAGKHQYSEAEMRKRIHKLKRKIQKHNGVDIVVSHAPLRGVGDGEDFAHRGFESFLEFIDQYHPKYWIHGHVHMTYGMDIERELEYHGTKVINAYERYVLEISDEEIANAQNLSPGNFLDRLRSLKF